MVLDGSPGPPGQPAAPGPEPDLLARRLWLAPLTLTSAPSRCSLAGSSINELVRDRARAAALHLDLDSLPGFSLPSGFGFGLGLSSDPSGVFAAGLHFGLLCGEALCGLVGLREQLVPAIRADLQAALDRVLAEQDGRARIATPDA